MKDIKFLGLDVDESGLWLIEDRGTGVVYQVGHIDWYAFHHFYERYKKSVEDSRNSG